MSSVMVIVSKAVFEKQGGAVGGVYATDGYASLHKSLDVLADGGSIFLVTVRPPDEALWLVGIVDAPKRGAAGWKGTPNTTPIRDISALRSALVFASGSGITAKPGALGMSLQTPRILTAADEALLRGAKRVTAKAKPKRATPAAVAPSGASAGSTTPGAAGPMAVIAALQAKDSAAALVATLAWWRASRAPEVADLLDAISEKVSGAPEGSQANWAKLARTADPVVLGRLLAGVPELPTSFLPAGAEMLAAFAPDPRISTALARWIFAPPTTSSSTHAFWTKMLDTVAKTGDARPIGAFEKRLRKADGTSQFWPKLFAGLAKLLKKLAAVPAAASAPTAKLLAAAQKLPPIDERRALGIVAARVAATTPAAPKLDGPLLDQAAQHLAAGRVEAAIDAMATHWREHRAPEVADLIDRANCLLPAWNVPLARTEKELQAAWEAAFRQPSATMPQLLGNLDRGTVKEMELRLVDLANLPDDPRIATRFAQLATSTLSPERAQVWKSIWTLLARHRDIRSVAPLLKEFRNFTSKYWYHHQHGRRLYGPFAFAPGEFPLPAGDAPRVAALANAIATAERSARAKERELVAAIAADPGDDAPRAVYADWLLEQGHPRGELINTALAGGDITELASIPWIFGGLSALAYTLERGLPVQLSIVNTRQELVASLLRAEPLSALIRSIELDGVTLADDTTTSQALASYLELLPNVRELVDASQELEVAGFRRSGTRLVRA